MNKKKVLHKKIVEIYSFKTSDKVVYFYFSIFKCKDKALNSIDSFNQS